MKVVEKSGKEVFEPVVLELTFESKRELEVLRAYLNLPPSHVNKSNTGISFIENVTPDEDEEIISPIYDTLCKKIIDVNHT